MWSRKVVVAAFVECLGLMGLEDGFVRVTKVYFRWADGLGSYFAKINNY